MNILVEGNSRRRGKGALWLKKKKKKMKKPREANNEHKIRKLSLDVCHFVFGDSSICVGDLYNAGQ